ncbi:MAG: hypothetical protein HC871_06440, partial [Rhizobiales bacterium]|nr:hypothetical protein [Hyphomicrobiales bacterium]
MIEVLAQWMRRLRTRRLLILTHDLIIVTSAFPISIVLRENFDPGPQFMQPAAFGTLILVLVAFLVLRIMGVQQNMWRYASPSDLLNLAKAISVIAAIFFGTMFFVDRLEGISRSVPIIFWLVAFAGLCSTRLIYSAMVNSQAGRGHRDTRISSYRILIAGSLEASSALVQTLGSPTRQSTRIVGIISDGAERGRTLHGIEILGRTSQLTQILASLDIAGCYPHAIIVDHADRYLETSLSTELTSKAVNLPILRSSTIHALPEAVNRNDLLAQFASEGGDKKPYVKIKRLIDISAAFFALIFLLPLLLLVACATCLVDGLPVLFVQIREGQNLREFRLLKFRTMRPPFD